MQKRCFARQTIKNPERENVKSRRRARTVFLTRMGIGVYDTRWWEARLRLFDAVTASSLTAFASRDVSWSLILDADVPVEVLDRLHEIVDRRGLRQIVTFDFIPDISFLPDGMRQAVLAASPSSASIHLQLLDDDDAVTPKMHDEHWDAFDKNFGDVQVASTDNGLVVDFPGGVGGLLEMVSYTVGTTFYGKPLRVLEAMRASHRQWLTRTEEIGGKAFRIEGGPGNWLYLYHRQADGDYEERVSRLKAEADMLDVRDLHLEDYSIDENGFLEAREALSIMPPTLGLTWRRTQPQTHHLRRLRGRASVVKRKAIEINTALFDDSVPFFYVLSPNPGVNVKAGTLSLKGVGSPGTEIQLWIKGRGPERLKGVATCEQDSGVWCIRVNLASATWGITLRQMLDGVAVNQFDYSIKVL